MTTSPLGCGPAPIDPRRLNALPGDGVPNPRLVGFAGIPVFVDRPRGFVQRKVGPDGALLWERTYQVDYGFIPGTAGGDGEPLDVFLGLDPAAPAAWWAHQVREDGSSDELKLLLGFADEGAARACYVAHIPERYLGSLSAGTVEQIRALVGVNPWTALAAKPEAPPAPLPPWLAPVTLAAPARGPVILADRGRSPLGPAVTGQLYLDRVVERGLDAAPYALRETLAAAMAAIEGARSYAEVAERLVALAPGAVERSQDFAALIEGAVLLGVGAGAWAVGEEADDS